MDSRLKELLNDESKKLFVNIEIKISNLEELGWSQEKIKSFRDISRMTFELGVLQATRHGVEINEAIDDNAAILVLTSKNCGIDLKVKITRNE